VSPIRVRYSDNSCALFAKCIYFVKRIYYENEGQKTAETVNGAFYRYYIELPPADKSAVNQK